MIRFILLQNRQGKTRLAKYYVPLEEDEKHQLETEVHRVVVNRDPKHTSFVEFKNHKLVYRRYAGLFFTLCVDANDNELVHLESIHLFVEILDHFFANVCELDLVFNFQKVYVIVDEFILAGEVQETSKKAILNRLAELEQIKGWDNVDGNINIYLDGLRALKQNYFKCKQEALILVYVSCKINTHQVSLYQQCSIRIRLNQNARVIDRVCYYWHRDISSLRWKKSRAKSYSADEQVQQRRDGKIEVSEGEYCSRKNICRCGRK